jgi:hypothetical protein
MPGFDLVVIDFGVCCFAVDVKMVLKPLEIGKVLGKYKGIIGITENLGDIYLWARSIIQRMVCCVLHLVAMI